MEVGSNSPDKVSLPVLRTIVSGISASTSVVQVPPAVPVFFKNPPVVVGNVVTIPSLDVDTNGEADA